MANGKFYVVVAKKGSDILDLDKDEIYEALKSSDDALSYDLAKIPPVTLISIPEESGVNWKQDNYKIVYSFKITWRQQQSEDESLLGEIRPGVDYSYSYKA